jgi:hypothetical protein
VAGAAAAGWWWPAAGPGPRCRRRRSVSAGAGISRRKLLSVDAASGRPTAWNPSANSALGVFALAPVPGGPLVAGGDFTQVGGAANRRLALFG